jgi:hypothetical protein
MKVGDIYNSGYLKAEDLRGSTVLVTIEAVELEELRDGERKLALTFRGKEKRLLLNVTNAQAISDALGDETSMWSGRQVELYTATVEFQGRRVPGIRVRGARADAPPATPRERPPLGVDDSIPF